MLQGVAKAAKGQNVGRAGTKPLLLLALAGVLRQGVRAAAPCGCPHPPSANRDANANPSQAMHKMSRLVRGADKFPNQRILGTVWAQAFQMTPKWLVLVGECSAGLLNTRVATKSCVLDSMFPQNANVVQYIILRVMLWLRHLNELEKRCNPLLCSESGKKISRSSVEPQRGRRPTRENADEISPEVSHLIG